MSGGPVVRIVPVEWSVGPVVRGSVVRLGQLSGGSVVRSDQLSGIKPQLIRYFRKARFAREESQAKIDPPLL